MVFPPQLCRTHITRAPKAIPSLWCLNNRLYRDWQTHSISINIICKSNLWPKQGKGNRMRIIRKSRGPSRLLPWIIQDRITHSSRWVVLGREMVAFNNQSLELVFHNLSPNWSATNLEWIFKTIHVKLYMRFIQSMKRSLSSRTPWPTTIQFKVKHKARS